MLVATSSLTHDFSIVAPSLSVLQCVTQAAHIRREGAEGVSLLTWVLSVFVAEIWTGYGLVFHVAAEIYSNFLFLAVAMVVIAGAARHQGRVRRSVSQVLGVTVLAIVSSLVALEPSWRWSLATAAVVGAIVIYLPQLMVTLHSSDLRGVSVISWSIALVTTLAWGLYGLRIRQVAVALPSVVMIPSSLVILVQVSRHRRRARGFEGAVSAPIIE